MKISKIRQAKEFFSQMEKGRRKKWAVCLSAAAVLFVTIYALVLPAITMEGPTYCGKDEHVHSDACYEKVLVCEKGTKDGASLNCPLPVHEHKKSCYNSKGELTCGFADYTVHEHDKNCYADGKLICTLKEAKEHKHDASCYKQEKTLVCGKEESEGHKHSDSCYTEKKELICDKEESEGHKHDESCYDEEGNLICEKEESEGHKHSDDCYKVTKELTCGKEESEGHKHTDKCYEVENVLKCKKDEVIVHVHDQSCYNKKNHTHTDECKNSDGVITCGGLKCDKIEVRKHQHSADEIIPASDHEHTDACYEKVLTCTKEEHEHTDVCYSETKTVAAMEQEKKEAKEHNFLATTEGSDADSQDDADAQDSAAENADGTEAKNENAENDTINIEETAPQLICGKEEHEHTESCYNNKGELTCQLETHIHTAECFNVSDMTEEEVDEFRKAEAGLKKKVYEDNDIRVVATYGEEAAIPEEAELRVSQITKESDPEHYEQRRAEALKAMKEKHAGKATLYNIGFFVGEKEIEPEASVTVTVQKMKDGFEVGEPITVVHFGDKETEVLTNTKVDENGNVTFSSDEFSNFMTIAGASSDLEDYIKGMHLQTKDENGNWVDVTDGGEIVVGNNYRLNVHLEGGSEGFTSPLNWDLGDDVKCEPRNNYPIMDGSTQIGTYTLTEDGKLTVTFTEEFLSNDNQKVDMYFDMVATKKPDNTGDQFPWSGQIRDTTTVDNVVELEVQKSAGWYNPKTGSITYTVEATVTKGMVVEGKLEDKMGEGLSFREIEDIKDMKVYDAAGQDVTAQYQEYIDKLWEQAEALKEKDPNPSSWSLSPLPPMSQGMRFVVEYKGEVAEGKRQDVKYTAENTVTFSGMAPDRTTPAKEDKDTAQKNPAGDQITKTGQAVSIEVGGQNKEVIEWQVRVGSGQWDPFESAGTLTMKDTLGTGLTFERGKDIVVQWCGKDGNVKKETTIKWDGGVTITEEGKVATYNLTEDMFGGDYNWEDGDYILVTYYTDFDPDKQPQTGYENTIQNDVLAPKGVDGKLPVGEAVQKTVVDHEEEGYLIYTVLVDIPPANQMSSMKDDSGDGHPDLDLPYFYIQDQLDFDGKYYAVNRPEEMTVFAVGKNTNTPYQFEYAPYTSGGGNIDDKRETFQILDGPNSKGDNEGEDLRAFRIFFNTARYGLGTEGELDRHDSIWDIQEATQLHIVYRIPYDTIVVDKDGKDTNMTLGELLNKGERLDNKARSRRSGVDLEDEESIQKTPDKVSIDKMARILNEGKVEYSVTFVNCDFKIDSDGDFSRLIKKPNDGDKAANKLEPTLTDTFDPRMEYVSGSLYVEVRSKDSNNLYATYKYIGKDPVSGNILTATMYEDDKWLQTENDGEHYIDKKLTDTFDEQRKYIFVYELQLKEENRQDWKTDEDIDNTATFKYGDQSVNDNVNIDIPADMLQKTVEPTETERLKYTLKVNTLGVDLVNIETDKEEFVNLDSYKLVDKMSENLQVITLSDGSYDITVEYEAPVGSGDWKELTRTASADNINKEALNYYLGNEEDGSIYFILPDNLPIRITYEVMVTGALNSKELANNEATLYADVTETDTKQTIKEVGNSGATASSDPTVRLQKEDSQTHKLLEGVEFTLYSSKKPDSYSGQPIYVIKDEKEVPMYPVNVYTTGVYGEINKISRPEGADPNDFYALIETETLDGYILDGTPRFFQFPDYSNPVKGGQVTYDGTEYEIRRMTAKETIAVDNTPEGYELPETGGNGTIFISLAGIALLGVGLIYKAELERRRRRVRAAGKRNRQSRGDM